MFTKKSQKIKDTILRNKVIAKSRSQQLQYGNAHRPVSEEIPVESYKHIDSTVPAESEYVGLLFVENVNYHIQ